ncbi:hypothetical protein NCS55_01466500 [Fusarium keratoplasticum]|nr:hypothetical protein NCS55_01466500 [Fusarium keratoplasticum]
MMNLKTATGDSKSIQSGLRPTVEGENIGTKTSGLTEIWHRVSSILGVELQGSDPAPVEHKTDRRYLKLFTLWFSMNFNLISISTGMSGTISFGLGFRDAALVIVFFGLLTSFSAPFMCIFGARLGLRQMIHARYAFGIYGSAIPLVLNMCTLAGYGILGSILGGQTLSAINKDALSIDGGIVIIALINLVLIFLGAKWIHRFDLFAWIPTLIAIIVAVGCGGKHMHKQVDAPGASVTAVFSFAAVIAGFFLPWSAIASDFTTYYDARSKKRAIFVPSYIGLSMSSIPLMILGAAIGGAIANVPSWQDGYDRGSVGGVLAAMLESTGRFGKFLLVLLALSPLGNVAGSVYALSLNFQALLYLARIRIPRVVYTLIITAVIIPIAIKVAAEFMDSLSNFLGIIGYWPSSFVAIIVLEHFVFRKGLVANYNVEDWNNRKALPAGVAALGAAFLSFGLVIPCMAQVWFIGPIAQHTGDLGFEIALVFTGILYVPLRYLELRLQGQL